MMDENDNSLSQTGVKTVNDDKYKNMCSKEPTYPCPDCGTTAYAEWVDNGFGPYAVQAAPYKCPACDWVEPCPYVNLETCKKCVSLSKCYTILNYPE